MRDAAYEIEFMRLVVFLYSFEFESSLFLFFEFGESHLSFMSGLGILQCVDHLDRFLEEGTIRRIDLLPDHDHLDDVSIPVIEDMSLSIMRESIENSHNIMTIFLIQGAPLEEGNETRVRHDSDTVSE